MKVLIEAGEDIDIYINTKKHAFYGFRARLEERPDIWEDGATKEEALGKLIIKLFLQKITIVEE